MPKPQVSGIFKAEKYLISYSRKFMSEPTLFRKYYERGDLPVAVSFVGALRKVKKMIFLAHMENGARTSRLSFTSANFF